MKIEIIKKEDKYYFATSYSVKAFKDNQEKQCYEFEVETYDEEGNKIIEAIDIPYKEGQFINQLILLMNEEENEG